MDVKAYLARMPGSSDFLALDDTVIDQWIFKAEQTLLDHYRPNLLTERVVALQTLYAFEGDGEDFAMLKRQGVETFSTEGLSVTFKSGAISPEVIGIIDGRARVGRLI